MKPREYYEGREQTYLKHWFLESYLEVLAYHVALKFNTGLVYVDGFSGPWRSQDEELGDTSFMIAIHKLRSVQDRVVQLQGRKPRVRCVFVEKDETSFRQLKRATENIPDIQCIPLFGEFEKLIPQVCRDVGDGFAFTFIDPTGWRGYDLELIAPLIRHRPGEVLVNFMFDYINRDLIPEEMSRLFGTRSWRDEPEGGKVGLFADRLKSHGQFRYSAFTRILKPLETRVYYYLVYATRHLKGLQEFKRRQESLVSEQENLRVGVQQRKWEQKTRQIGLFHPEELASDRSYHDVREQELSVLASRGRTQLLAGPVTGEEFLGEWLQHQFIWESDIDRLISELRNDRLIEVHGMSSRARKLIPKHRIFPK